MRSQKLNIKKQYPAQLERGTDLKYRSLFYPFRNSSRAFLLIR
jgi:hypothetical protein